MIAFPPTNVDRFVDALAAEFSGLYGRGRRILALDSLTPQPALREALAQSLARSGRRVFTASLEGFVRPFDARSSRGATGAAIYFDRYDTDAFVRVLVEPFLLGGSTGFVPAVYDAEAEREVEPVWLTAPADAVLVLDGPFLQRPELRGRFHYVVHLQTADPALPEWIEAGELYAAQAQPRRAADAVVDVTDPSRPVRVFADSC